MSTQTMTSYPLPKAPQEYWTKYHNKKVDAGVLSGYKIVWVGVPLPCRFRSDTVKGILTPQHVFIVKGKQEFVYCLRDSMDTMNKLPKKYFTTCFPHISLTKVPTDNRFDIKLSKRKTITLPYIPDSFLEQKKNKVKRKRRKVFHEVEQPTENPSYESIQFNVANVPRWHVLNNEQNKNHPTKQDILMLIRSLVEASDGETFTFSNPFEQVKEIDNIKNNEQLLSRLKIVTGFIYHYCRRELGLVTMRVEHVDKAKAFLKVLRDKS